jgi:hypothetical protein
VSVQNLTTFIKSHAVKFLPSIVVVMAIVVVLLVFEPPKDVEARIGRPYVSAVNPCNQSDLLTVDVADKRYISRLRVSESFTGLPTELPAVRVQSVEDGESNIFVLKTELQTGVVETVVFDPDGFPIVTSPDTSSTVRQLRVRISISSFVATSEPILVPTSSGFYLFAQLQNGDAKVVRISLDSTGRRFTKPKSIILRSFNLSGVRPGFAVALADQIVVITGQETVVRIRARSENSELEQTDLKLPGNQSRFLGRPLLVSTGSDVFALISTGTSEAPTLISLSVGGNSDFSTLDDAETKSLIDYEVIAASPRSSDYGVFLLRQSNSGTALSSHISVVVAEDGRLHVNPIELSNSSSPVAVLGNPGAVMVVGNTKTTGELSYQINRSTSVSGVSNSATFETVLTQQQVGCIEQIVAAVNPVQNQASNQWLEFVAIRAAVPIVQGGLLFLSGPFSTYDCVVQEDEIGLVDLAIHCASGGKGYVEKEAAPVVDLVNGRLKIAVAAAEREKATSTTTLPPSNDTEQDNPPEENTDTVTVENRDCAQGSEVPRPPTLIGGPSEDSRSSQRSGRSTLDVVLRVYKSGSSSCYPDAVEITVCEVNKNAGDCENPQTKKFDIRDRGNELGGPFLIEKVKGRDGKINRVTAVAIRNSKPSEVSEAIEIDMDGEVLCQPRGVKAKYSSSDEKWNISWDLVETNTDCEDVFSSKYVVEVLKCTQSTRPEFLVRADGVFEDSVTIKAVNDSLIDNRNLRGQSISFQVLSVPEDTGEKLSPVRSSPTQCAETTTSALTTIDLKALGLSTNAIKSERKFQIKGTLENGSTNYLGLTRTLGTSTFQSLCFSWQRNSISFGEELCVSNEDLQERSRVLSLDFKNIGCVKGTWQLLFVPKGPTISTRKHNFSVPIEVECSFVFNGVDFPQIEISQPVKNGTSPPQEWSLTATVDGLGFDIEELGSDVVVAASLSCDLWNGQRNSQYFSVGEMGRVTPTVSSKKVGAAELRLTFDRVPRIRKLKDGCQLVVEATPPGSPSVVGRWPINLSEIGLIIADEVAIEVGETIANNMKSVAFSREFAANKYTSTITASDLISCPTVGEETDFAVNISIGGGNPTPCINAGTDFAWPALSVEVGAPATSLSKVKLDVGVSTQSGSITRSLDVDLTASVCLNNTLELNNPCDDPRVPKIDQFKVDRTDGGDVIFTIGSTNWNLTRELTVCKVKTEGGELSDCVSRDSSSPEQNTFQFQGFDQGATLWLSFGVKSPNIKSSVVIQVTVPSAPPTG